MNEQETKEAMAAEEVISTDVVASGLKWTNKYLIGLGIIIIIGIVGYLLFAYVQLDAVFKTLNKDHHLFYWMLLVGFLAEIVAGSMGMGYGVICTTILLILNVSPPIISTSIHSAESFTTAAGSISHYKLGNVNKKLTKLLASLRSSGQLSEL